ncbi:uncharacterized oxidoreductase YtbE-like isoform X2 [Mytilus californianus]|uniref:uncharacterized oxidoreductase YtbE-like isoform X2 n=1 Tax=Mytilus californianus TaxID=6549 RepID=UPI0022468DF3|nr:uncharacterized oxidoreductase YtbE-like isoform X2 [Mytilus californianus]
MTKRMVSIATDITSRLTLNDGVCMPMFGLGMYEASSGSGGVAEKAVEYALSKGYHLIDTAEFYGNEADVGMGVKKSGLNREDIFVVTKLWDNGFSRCKKIFNRSLKISVGVSNFGVQHLEGLESAGLPTPSVNQIELHPWQQKPEIVKYCRDKGITVMGYSPLVKGQRFDDPTLVKIANRYKKSAAQILIRWSIQHGFITIPKSGKTNRIDENMKVFDWAIADEDMAVLNSFPDKSCTWNPCKMPWTG